MTDTGGTLRPVQAGRAIQRTIELVRSRRSNVMKFALLLIATILLAAPVSAEDYEKGPNGGLMLDVAGIDAELLTSGTTVAINVFEAFKAKPVSTKGRWAWT
jgi:hypothetical protein